MPSKNKQFHFIFLLRLFNITYVFFFSRSGTIITHKEVNELTNATRFMRKKKKENTRAMNKKKENERNNNNNNNKKCAATNNRKIETMYLMN
jgi:hypothetical protein